MGLSAWLLVGRTRFGQLAVLFREAFSRRYIGQRRLHFVFPASHNIAFAAHHRLESRFRNFRWIILVTLTKLCIQETSSAEEFCFRAPRHQTRHTYAGIPKLLAQGKRKRIDKGL